MVKSRLIKFNSILYEVFGLNIVRFLGSFKGLFFYVKDCIKFRKMYAGRFSLYPCLHDRFAEGGVTKSEYFVQDLLVARWISEEKPNKHVDIGSRVDGFVAHVASFRDLEVFDVRSINTKIPGIIFNQADFMCHDIIKLGVEEGYCDSISCLHAIEHFGLGRYGDTIDPYGYERGIVNMAKLLRAGGLFYLSTPIGKERVEFNAHRVFDPKTIINLCSANKLLLKKLTVIKNGVVENIQFSDDAVKKLSEEVYSLGIFVFQKHKLAL